MEQISMHVRSLPEPDSCTEHFMYYTVALHDNRFDLIASSGTTSYILPKFRTVGSRTSNLYLGTALL